MKQCPSCRTNYTDDSLKYCLQDGTELVENRALGSGTEAIDDAETVVSPRQVEPIRIDVPDSQWRSWEESKQVKVRPTETVPIQPVQIEPAPTKSNTTSTVLLTVLGMLALLAIAGIGGWLYLNNRKTEVAVNVNTSAPNSRSINANAVVTNQELNANLAAPPQTPKATLTPAPKPTLNSEQSQAVTDDVENLVDEWKASSENLELDAHLSQYAPTVDYYKGGRIGLARVRADKQRAYEQFDSITFNITNMKVTPDASGEKASAIFDKEWTFEGENKFSSGKVQQQLTLNKIDGKWKITGEKDLKIYYIE
jgi:hypothetical protein